MLGLSRPRFEALAPESWGQRSSGRLHGSGETRGSRLGVERRPASGRSWMPPTATKTVSQRLAFQASRG